MGLKRSLICLSCVWLLQLINNVDGVAVETQEGRHCSFMFKLLLGDNE